MTATEQQNQFDKDLSEKTRVEQIVAGTPLLEGIDRVTVEFGTDQSGDPALWLIFAPKPGLHIDDPWLIRFNDFSSQLGLRIIDSGLSRFPYTRLRSAA